jgi:regulator of protease activity HflC (stomatin/prohibitin superfamily)
MGWFVISIIVAVLAVLAFLGSGAISKEERGGETRRFGFKIAGGLVVLALIFAGFGSLYRQDPGEAKVLRSISGEVIGETYEAGFHGKAPWVSATTWDIRDNTVSYIAGGETNYTGGDATGPRITVQDKDGVDADIDLTLRYSIKGDRVSDLYSRFGSQENVLTKVIEPGIRSAMREIPVTYTTLGLLNKRAEIQAEVKERLTKEFDVLGIVVEDVDIQEIVQPEAIKNANAEKAAAQALVDTEKARLEQAKIEAQKNATKSKELSPEILQQQFIEAIAKKGFVVITENGAVPMLQMPNP